MENLENISVGEVLNEEFLKPLNITPYRISKEIGVSQTRMSEILKGKRRITADTALRFSLFFGNSAKFWMGIQSSFDLEIEKMKRKEDYAKIKAVEMNR